MAENDSWTAAWQRLGTPPPAALAAARVQLHWAAQLAASIGKTLIPRRPDDSNQSFAWRPRSRRLVQDPVDGARRFAAALDPAALCLLLVAEDGDSLASYPLAGRTVDDALGWLAAQAARLRGAPLETLPRPEEMPDHPLAEGAPFADDDAATRAELARWYHDAHHALVARVLPRAGATPVRLWPHHFDLASLIELEPGADPETARSIGVGLSPGDGNYPDPYWYVTPYPAPDAGALPELAVGRWHTDGWVGALLDADQVVAAGDAAAQAARVGAYLDAAIDLSLGLLAA